MNKRMNNMDRKQCHSYIYIYGYNAGELDVHECQVNGGRLIRDGWPYIVWWRGTASVNHDNLPNNQPWFVRDDWIVSACSNVDRQGMAHEHSCTSECTRSPPRMDSCFVVGSTHSSTWYCTNGKINSIGKLIRTCHWLTGWDKKLPSITPANNSRRCNLCMNEMC